MRTFVIGDIHGAHLALEQCLKRCGIDRKIDRLITLGDICDGWPFVYETIEILLTIQNHIDIKGNHDAWFSGFLQWVSHPANWAQGGHGTLKSYTRQVDKDDGIYERWHWDGEREMVTYDTTLTPDDIPYTHQKFFRHQVLYYIDDDRHMLFVHGGFDPSKSIKENRRNNAISLYWDRSLWDKAMCVHGDPDTKLKTVENFNAIFIGHTATTNWSSKEFKTPGGIIIPGGERITHPMFSGGVWNLDTGAGGSGKLTIMDIDTKEYWQSDLVTQLYSKEFANR